MTTSQFACPHCHGRFQVDNRSAGATLACPHCGGRIAVPPGLVNDPAAPLTVENPAVEQPPAEPFVPFDFRDEPSVPAQPKIEPEEFLPNLLRFSRTTRQRRAQRSLLVMILCLAVLAAAVVLASRF